MKYPEIIIFHAANAEIIEKKCTKLICKEKVEPLRRNTVLFNVEFFIVKNCLRRVILLDTDSYNYNESRRYPRMPAPDIIIDVGFYKCIVQPGTILFLVHVHTSAAIGNISLSGAAHLTRSQQTSGSQACCRSWSGNMR